MKYGLIALVVVIVGTILSLVYNDTNSDSEKTDSDGQVKGVTSMENQNNQFLKKISISDANKMIDESKNDDNFVLLDIRTPEEFEAGSIEGSINIDFYTGFEERISSLDKDKRYLIYCRTGNRTGQAMSVFERKGFKEVYDMDGGYAAWTNLVK